MDKKIKKKHRAYVWAMLDFLEGKIDKKDINKKQREYLKQAEETKRQLGFNPLEA